MKVKFIKDHPVGVKKGTKTEANAASVLRWHEKGYIECDCSDSKKLIESKKTKEVAPKATEETKGK